jgi:hypothetical protein
MRIHVPYSKAIMEAHKSISVGKAKLWGCTDSDHIDEISSPIYIILGPIMFVPMRAEIPLSLGLCLP